MPSAVSKLVGSGYALASERGYAVRTLGGGVLRELGRGIRGDGAGFARAAAIVIGLAVTTAGYVVGAVSAPSTPIVTPDPADPVEP